MDQRYGNKSGGSYEKPKPTQSPPAQNTSVPQSMSEPERITKILEGVGEIIVDSAQTLAEEISKLERTQLRNFYNPLMRTCVKAQTLSDDDTKEIQKIVNKLQLIRPRLVYMAARKKEASPLKTFFDKLIAKVKTRQQVLALLDFAEAVVAYHRQYAK